MAWRRLGLSLLLLIFGAPRLEATPMYQGHEYDLPSAVVCLNKEAAIAFVKKSNFLPDWCIVARLVDFSPWYKVSNSTVINTPDILRFIFGKTGTIRGLSQFSSIEFHNRDVYVMLDAVLLGRDGRDVSVNDPDFDK